MNVSLLLTQNYRPLSVAALLDVLQSVNTFYLSEGKEAFFKVSLVSHNSNTSIDGKASLPLAEVGETDIVFVPAFKSGDISHFLQDNYRIFPWLQEQFNGGTEIASFCTGAYLLAAAGLLNGRKATTHVIAANEFKKHFPEVILEIDKVVTDDGGIYTSGGAASTFHLLLYLVEKYCGRDIAVRASKYFAIDMDRERQTYFASFNPGKFHNDDIVAQAQKRMEASFCEISTVEALIRELPVSPRNFIRRFKIATGFTPIEYLQNTRIEAAKKLLENSRHSITEIVDDVGYSDTKTFRLLFKRIVGLTPRAYREKFVGKKQELALA